MAGMKKIRPIDANALAESIKRYMKDYRNAPTRLTVCRSILSMLGDENQTPTLTSDHFPDVKKMVPLTLEQLQGMDGQPVWVTPAGFWALVIAKTGQRVQLICNDGEKVWADKEIELVGPVYAYPPAHIDREAWTAEWEHFNTRDVGNIGCSKCGYAFARLYPNKFCPNCGRATTPEALATLENRLRGC